MPNFTGFGVDLAKTGLVVVDVDTHDGTLQAYDEYALLELPLTRYVDTPTGGRHYYFKGTCRSRNNFRKGVDVKAMGGYVVAPFSKHPTASGMYTIGSAEKCAPFPKSLCDELSVPCKEEQCGALRHDFLCEPDLPENNKRAVEYLRHEAPTAIEGHGGDTVTFRVASELRDLGISEELAYAMMLDNWNERCVPPWRDKELLSKVRNAYRYASNRPGCKSLSFSVFDSVEAPQHEGMFKQLASFDSEPPKTDWIIEGWLANSPTAITMLAAPGGTGKSYVMLQLGMSVASGYPWLGLPVKKKMPVFMMCAEDAEEEVHRRLYAIRRSEEYDGAGHPPFYVAPLPGTSVLLATEKHGVVNATPFAKKFVEQVNEIEPGEKVVILDTLSDIFSGDENARSPVSQFVKSILAGMAKDMKANIIIIAHPGKVDGSTYSGNTAWDGSVRCRWFLSRPSKDQTNPARKLSREKSNYSTSGDVVMLTYKSGRFVKSEEYASMYDPNQMVLEAITSAYRADMPLSKTAQSSNSIFKTVLADKLDKKVIKDCLISLTKNGLIEEVDIKKKPCLAPKNLGGDNGCPF